MNLHEQEITRQHTLSHDPYKLMPPSFPGHPRVLCTAADIQRVKQWMTQHEWVKLSVARLLANADKASDVPEASAVLPAEPGAKEKIGVMIAMAEKNALAYLLVGGDARRDRATKAIQTLAKAYARMPRSDDNMLAGGGLAEAHQSYHLARACDLVEAIGVDEADRELIHAMLRGQYQSMDATGHRTCGNHNTWSQVGRVALAAALGDFKGLHDALYGSIAPPSPDPDIPPFRYGLVHMLRHDILSDGVHWERTTGYHFYTLMGFTEAALTLANIGVDLWNAKLPAGDESEGYDLHRAYESEGVKCLKAAYDAPLYQAMTNGDMSLLHDSGLANWRGITTWGIIYDAAYDAYKDPAYAWLLNRIERDSGKREFPGIPMPLQTHRGDLDFVRCRSAVYPAGEFSFAKDKTISMKGRHERGCTLFPTQGLAVLRSDARDEKAPGAILFWGPHSAGHMDPAALHLDLHAGGNMFTATPAVGGYEDPRYIDWARATIAHNTVTVDQRQMFPYDLEGDSIWEADSWRRRTSDGTLELFQPDEGFSALRASTQNAYFGVKLDRTVVLTPSYLIDAFRVFSDAEHEYDWAMHFHGNFEHAYNASPYDLGNRRGYNNIKDAVKLNLNGLTADLAIKDGSHQNRVQLCVPEGASVVLAKTIPGKNPEYGEALPRVERCCALARCRGKSALFLAVWQFDVGPELDVRVIGALNPHRPIELKIGNDTEQTTWHLPIQAGRVRLNKA